MINPIEALDAYNLLKNKGKSSDEIKRIQDKKLQKLLKYSYENVPYYHNVFDSLGLKPEEIQSADKLTKLPLLTKKIIKSFPLEHFVARKIDIKKCRTAKTGGTTSVPLQVFFQWRDARQIGIALVRSLLACGVKPWHRIASISGFASNTRKRKKIERFGIWRCIKLYSWDYPESWIIKLQKWRPHILYGYFMSLTLLVDTITESKAKGINPQIIISTGGILDKTSREKLSSFFGARVFDFYGSWEGGNIAWECPLGSGYHVNSDMVVLEILSNGKPVSPGQEGEVVITNLHSYAMPFIRYCQGDAAILSKKTPDCGCPFPLIESIKGRLADYVTIPSGRRISPLPFLDLMSNSPDLAQYRIVQEKINLLSIEIVPTKEFQLSSINFIKKELKKLVGPDMKISISLVNENKISPVQKRRQLISKLSENREENI
jgi:phenylacetate-CoA ligase